MVVSGGAADKLVVQLFLSFHFSGMDKKKVSVSCMYWLLVLVVNIISLAKFRVA